MSSLLTARGRWLELQRPLDTDSVALFCFSYAGGSGSAFRSWQAGLPGLRVVPIQLPGRCTRLAEPARDDLTEQAAEIADAIGEVVATAGVRYALFGHSMGGLLAYETAQQLRRCALPGPVHLFASASRPPHQYGAPGRPPYTDAELRTLVRQLGGQPADGPLADSYLQRRLPVLRADLAACDGYRWQPQPPLDCPMTTFAASDDPIASAQQLAAWRSYTSRSFVARTVGGNHFFLLSEPGRQQLLRQLGDELRWLTEPYPPALSASLNGMTA